MYWNSAGGLCEVQTTTADKITCKTPKKPVTVKYAGMFLLNMQVQFGQS